MSPNQQNLLVVGALVAFASVAALLVGMLSSETLRHEGLRSVIKRWLGR